MFSIYLLDSSKLFQWDLNRKIKIIGKEEVDEVHFSHVGDEEALVVKPIKENNILIANIPNILLQESKDIFVYLVSKDKTLKETFFTVGRREKPTDYLYTEIDILNYSSLEKRLVELEEKLNNIPVEETDPTVPDWAKQPNKPRYTAAEVGALSSTETVRQLAQKQDKSNLVTSINESSVDSTYPSTRAVYEYVGEEFARLVGSAPDALNTIEELAAAFNNNQDVVEALNAALTNKQDRVDSVGLKIAQGGEIFNDYQNNTASREYSHAEGLNTKALAPAAHSEGEGTFARTTGSHAEGMSTEAGQENGQSYTHAEGVSSKAYGRGSHAEGELTLAQGNYSHAEGSNSQATGAYAHAEGYKNGNAKTTASGQGSHAEGHGTTAEGTASHSEGEGTHALGELSHAEGRLSRAAGRGSHAEGDSTVAGDNNASLSNDVSALEAYQNQVPGAAAHTEGIGTLAKKAASHAEGYKTISEGNAAHAEGNLTKAQGNSAHSEGFNTIARGDYQHVQGKYNIEDTSNQYAHIIGGGSSNSDRKNIHTIKWDGTAEYQGDVVANACGGTNPISLVDTFNKLNDKIDSPSVTTVGQLLSVKSVDENGKPTEWETMASYAMDISKTPGYQKTITAQQIIIDISNPFSLGLYFSPSLLTYFKIMNGDQELNKYTLGQPRLIEFTKISATDVIFVFYYRTQQVAQYHYSVNSNSWEERILNYAAASINSKLNEKISNPLTASVGQILEVEEVDENGVPTKWKAVDKPEVVTTTTDDKGKIVTVNSEGNKILEYPSIISYKYADKIQESNTGVLFCFDTAKPNLGLFSMPNKITTFRVYKDGVYIQDADLKTYNPFIEINVIDCNETRIFVIGKLSSGKVVCYFYYFSSNKWSVETQMLPLESLENMFIQAPNKAEVGQILSVKAVDENGRPTEWEIIDAPTGSGGDGFSPIASVEQTADGAEITITDKSGTTKATVKNGKDGDDGKTAYQYAKDGGYTGTEEEFAQKMAKELPTKLSDLENDSSFVKNTDYASAATAGVMKVNIGPASGLGLENGEKLRLVGAGQKTITERYGDAPITPANLDYAVRSGLISNRLEWTEQQKQSARDLIGASDSGVEITSGEPTKESTVMTLNPNAEEVNLYTAPEIDEMLQNLPSGGSAGNNKTLLGEVVVTGHRKIQPLAIDYATGIITVDDCSFLPDTKVPYTHYKICIRKKTDAFYPNNVIPSELYNSIGIEKISDNTLYLYTSNTKIESYATSETINLNAWYLEYSEVNTGLISVDLTGLEFGNHLQVEFFNPCAEIQSVVVMKANVYGDGNNKYLDYNKTDGIRPLNGDTYAFDSVRGLPANGGNKIKGNSMPIRYIYDFVVDDFIYATGKNVFAVADSKDKLPVYYTEEKTILLQNYGLTKFEMSLGVNYLTIPEGSYIKVWEVHD